MWATGAGSDVMKRIAAPMVGGIFTSFILELLVYPAIYEIWRWHGALKRQLKAGEEPAKLRDGLEFVPQEPALHATGD
jgi:hypothetical protein